MTKIPKISIALQKKHEGESVAIVNGKIVAFAKDSYKAEQKALIRGFDKSDIMTTYIMGKKQYVL